MVRLPISRPPALTCSAISAAGRAPCAFKTPVIAALMVWRVDGAVFSLRADFSFGRRGVFIPRAGSNSSATSSRSAIRRSLSRASSSEIFARMRSSELAIAALFTAIAYPKTSLSEASLKIMQQNTMRVSSNSVSLTPRSPGRPRHPARPLSPARRGRHLREPGLSRDAPRRGSARYKLSGGDTNP